METGFDPLTRHLHLDEGGEALDFEAGRAFWADLMSGDPQSLAGKRVAGGGWLVTTSEPAADMGHWEMHPEGDEVFLSLGCDLELILDQGGKERRVDLKPGQTFTIPKGAWHRWIVRETGRLLVLTYGRGTQHRPL